VVTEITHGVIARNRLHSARGAMLANGH